MNQPDLFNAHKSYYTLRRVHFVHDSAERVFHFPFIFSKHKSRTDTARLLIIYSEIIWIILPAGILLL